MLEKRKGICRGLAAALMLSAGLSETFGMNSYATDITEVEDNNAEYGIKINYVPEAKFDLAAYGLSDKYVPVDYEDKSGSPMVYEGKNLCWVTSNGKNYWYENDIKQGTYYDPKGVIGEETNRGREICDNNIKDLNGNGTWFWLDSCYNGAKAVGKEVWIPYIYQQEDEWDDPTLRAIANESDPGMEDLVYNFMKEKKGKWVRYDEDGKMLKGWVTIHGSLAEVYPEQKGNTYYYDTRTGLMAKGWVNIGGTNYYFDETTGVLDDSTSGGKNNTTSYIEFANEMLAKVNALRREQGVGELTLDEQCKNVGAVRVVEISTLYSHTRPNGKKSSTTWDDLGYQWSGVGENIAKIGNYYNTSSSLTQKADEFYDLFKNSSGHYSTMINSRWTKAYFNIYITYKDDGETVYYCVQTFSK